MENYNPDEWMPLTQAARKAGISQGKLSGWVKKKCIGAWIAPPWDERLTLVSVADLEKIFKRSFRDN